MAMEAPSSRELELASRCRSTWRSTLCRVCSSSATSSSWLLVVYAFFAIAFTNGCFRSITIFMPDFIVEFESSALLMGWIFSIDPFMLGIMTPFAAYFTTKFGTRPVVMVAGTFAASGVMWLSQARHIALVGIAIGVVTSMTQATVYASSVLLVRRSFRLHYALAHGIVISGYSCGLFVFPPILEAISTTFSWRGTCLIASGFMFQTVLFGALMKASPKDRRRYEPIEKGEKSDVGAIEGHQHDITSRTTSLINCDSQMIFDPVRSVTDNFQTKSELETGLQTNPILQISNEISNEFPDVIRNGTHCSSESDNSRELSEVRNKSDATTTNKLTESYHSLTLDGQGNSHIGYDADNIPVSGVGSSQRTRYLRHFTKRNYHTFAIYTLSMFSTTVGYSIFLLHLSTSFKEFGIDLNDIATSFSVFAACNLIGRITNGLIIAAGVPPAYLMTMAELVAFLSIIAVFMCTIFPIRVTAVALYGLGTGVYTTLFYVYHREIVDPKVDVKTLSIFMFFEGLAGPCGGSLGGLLRDVTGNYQVTYFTSAALSLFAALLTIAVIFMERHRIRRSERLT